MNEKNDCKGCAARDEINQRLAERIDELEAKLKETEKTQSASG